MEPKTANGLNFITAAFSDLNDYSGKSVIVTSAGIDHGLTNRASIDQMAATHALPELIKAARVTTVPDTEGRSDIVAIHRLDSQITVGGRQYAARMTVYENKDGDWLYAYRLRKERGSQGNAAGPLELRPLRSSNDTIVPSSPPVKENPADIKYSIAPADEAGIPDAKKDSKSYIESARKQWLEKGTDSPFFKRWFGESKVVDESGKPLVVYHGTRRDFTEFNMSMAVEELQGTAWAEKAAVMKFKPFAVLGSMVDFP